jgi:hypothetical protein
MSIRFRLTVFLLAGVSAGLQAQTVDKLVEETSKVLKETTAALIGVKDANGAKAVLPRLDQFQKQFEKVQKEALRRGKGDPGQPDKEFVKAMERLQQVYKALEKELMRLDTDPKTHKAIRDHAVIARFRESQETRALIDVQSLSAQCETFKLNNGQYPSKIEELGQKQPGGGAALVPADRLRDPWGQLYRIDGAGTKNKRRRCDVWSIGHPIEKRVIGNWMKPGDDTPKRKKDVKKDRNAEKGRGEE